MGIVDPEYAGKGGYEETNLSVYGYPVHGFLSEEFIDHQAVPNMFDQVAKNKEIQRKL